jgi:small subunit ribosomal protein S1
VKNLTDFGAFVELAEGIEGLVHITDFSWTERV